MCRTGPMRSADRSSSAHYNSAAPNVPPRQPCPFIAKDVLVGLLWRAAVPGTECASCAPVRSDRREPSAITWVRARPNPFPRLEDDHDDYDDGRRGVPGRP